MTNTEAIAAMIDALNASGIEYMITGSLASSHYGIPRLSLDADFVVEPGNEPIPRRLAEVSPLIRVDPQMSFETVTHTYRHLATISGSPFKLELFLLSDDEHDRTRFSRRVQIEFMNRKTWIASPEDVVITKLRWAISGNRAKDVLDVHNVLVMMRDHLDWNYVRSWCGRHGSLTLLDEILAKLPSP